MSHLERAIDRRLKVEAVRAPRRLLLRASFPIQSPAKQQKQMHFRIPTPAANAKVTHANMMRRGSVALHDALWKHHPYAMLAGIEWGRQVFPRGWSGERL